MEQQVELSTWMFKVVQCWITENKEYGVAETVWDAMLAEAAL